MTIETNPKLNTQTTKILKWVLLGALAILFAVGGAFGWQSNADLKAKNIALETKISDLEKQLETAEASAPANSACNSSATADLKANIKDAISSKNYAALEGYMAASVNVVFAASEKGGPVTPAQAVSDLDYLNSATSPWNFALPAATLASYKAGGYGKYFGAETYVGRSANDYVVSFDFNCSTKIDVIFITGNADLLN